MALRSTHSIQHLHSGSGSLSILECQGLLYYKPFCRLVCHRFLEVPDHWFGTCCDSTIVRCIIFKESSITVNILQMRNASYKMKRNNMKVYRGCLVTSTIMSGKNQDLIIMIMDDI